MNQSNKQVAFSDFEFSITTMSSVEIADLTGKRHDHVMRDIRNMLDELNIQSPQFWGDQTFANNRKREVFNLPKRECLILVSGYSVDLRAKIIDRWQELEGHRQTPLIPQSLPEALRLAADLAEKNTQLEHEVAEAKPKVAALDRIATADGSLCVTDAAKQLQIQPKKLFLWLQQNQWIYRRPGKAAWIGYQHRIQQGLLEHKISIFTKDDGTEQTTSQVRITPKGLTKLSDALSQEAQS